MNWNKQRDRLRKKAEATGWMAGRDVLSISMDKAQVALQRAGLTVYKDKLCIFGPLEESQQAVKVLALAGDKVSQQILIEKEEKQIASS